MNWLDDPVEEIVSGALKQGSESKFVEYKGRVNWKTCDNKTKLGIVKDILAFSNTSTGGFLLFGVDAKSHEPIGMQETEQESFDTTPVSDFVKRYADPEPTIRVAKCVFEGNKYVVVIVSEFADIPIVCKADASVNSDKNELRCGAIYIRTDSCQSRELHSANETRELLNRAVTRRGDRIVSDLRNLLTSDNPLNQREMDKQVSKDLELAEKELQNHLDSKFGQCGRFLFVAYPNSETLNEKKLSELREAVIRNKLSLRGLDFPHTENNSFNNISNGVRCFPKNLASEGLFFFRSGLFAWSQVLKEDITDHPMKEYKVLHFGRLVAALSEYTLFIGRLFNELRLEGDITLVASIIDTSNRHIWPLVPKSSNHDFDDFPKLKCIESTAKSEVKISIAQLRIEPGSIADKLLLQIAELFNITFEISDLPAQWRTLTFNNRYKEQN